jgi:lysophospholipase
MSGPDNDPRRTIPAGMEFSHWPARDGWRLRSFTRLPAGPPRGSLLFLGGRGDFVEKYLEAFDHWHRAGWRIDGFDWRGQGGSGRFLKDPSICHLENFDQLVDDLEAYLAGWRDVAPGPYFVIAHSMGAHVLLRLLAERDGRCGLDGAALLAPMLGIARGPLPPGTMTMMTKAALAAGLGSQSLWRRDPGNSKGRMTSCPHRQSDKIWWKANKPEIASGAPSWRWLDSAITSIRRLQRSPGLPKISIPLLIMVAEKDPIIDVAAMRRVAQQLPNAALHILSGTGHELLREADHRRLPVLNRIDDFLARAGSDQ